VSGLMPGKIGVGVVVERRKAQSPWIDFTWRPVMALPGLPDAAPWTTLAQDDDKTIFYAGSAEIALYRTETSNYRDNLGSGAPMLWIALRPTGVEPPYEIFAVTADPAEGEAWTEAGADIVDVVPMPEAVRAAKTRGGRRRRDEVRGRTRSGTGKCRIQRRVAEGERRCTWRARRPGTVRAHV